MTALRIALASLLASTALTQAALAQNVQAPPLRQYQAQEPAPQRPTRTRPLREGVTGLGQTQDVIREPRFIVEAMSFKAVDESGRDLPYTSDEVFATFQASGYNMMTSTIEQVDSGDLEEFDAEQRCIWGAVDPDGEANGRWACSPQGLSGPIRFTATLYDSDPDLPWYGFRICPGPGDLGRCTGVDDHDVLFQNEFAYEVSDVIQRLDPNCRCLVQTARQSVDSLTTYEFTFRITRVDDGRDPPAVDRDPGGASQPVHRSGDLTANVNQRFDFDAGVIGMAGGDFAFTESNNQFFLSPAPGARIWPGNANARGYAACAAGAANHVTTAVQVPAAGVHACFITGDGRVGELRIVQLTDPPFGGTPTLALSYATWQ